MRALVQILAGLAMVMFAVSTASADVVNGSFEAEHDALMPNGSLAAAPYWGMPDNWSWQQLGTGTNGHGNNATYSGWSSDGQWALYVFGASSGPHAVGDYLEFYQTVDLEGLAAISFDVNRILHSNYVQAYLSVNGMKLWTEQSLGTWYDVTVDVSGYSGAVEVALGVEILEVFPTDEADGHTYFDNLRLVPEPATMGLVGLGLATLAARRRRQSGR